MIQEFFIQAIIAVTGLTAVYLTQQSNESLKKYACLFGLAGQPFWLYATWGQWGMFTLCAAYTFAWFAGFKNQWL